MNNTEDYPVMTGEEFYARQKELELEAESIAESNRPLTLAKKLVNVMAEAGSIVKGGTNKFQNYNYITESDVAKKMQSLFVKHGIFVLANTVAHKATPLTSKDKNGNEKVQMFTQVDIEYTFINADNPEDTYSVRAYGEGMDTGDKAGYKASTGCHKYFLIRNFNLGSDEDAEKESPEAGTAPAKKFTQNQSQGGFI